MYSGFDKELFNQYSIHKKQFNEKENIIITVGRLGSMQKNTEMLLEAASNIVYKNWKIVLIGPIEKREQDLQKKIDVFYSNNPGLKDKVIFTGPIYDKKELWNWYNRAKVFVLTSIYESFGIVLNEALFFQNYIVTTEVGASKEMLQMGYGQIIPQRDAAYLANVLQRLIDENKLENLYNNVKWEDMDISWEKYVGDATANLLIQ
jgi:glycosyltransferase involved in cell wall biosynthesis